MHIPEYTPNYTHSGFVINLSEKTRAVCHIVLPNGGGTSFLIGRDLIMTNNHVLDSLEKARSAKALFFYHENARDVVEVDLNPDDFFCTSPSPDRLVLSLQSLVMRVYLSFRRGLANLDA